ncbi:MULTISPECIES: helix-turn-helix transcriptional regulator [unclassified Bradyrhizobium]|uniref:helix-turn-helix domain-containing protein n=1 Tax=unclassified Bradyrhizobium TaxID=2631580 RepID=UPI0029169C3E|nr:MULTISPECIES: helix-turn-helix transcriptional regulator [unclassified Bradyrhizobium]
MQFSHDPLPIGIQSRGPRAENRRIAMPLGDGVSWMPQRRKRSSIIQYDCGNSFAGRFTDCLDKQANRFGMPIDFRSRMNDLRDTVARNLRRLRTGKGWTQEELAFRAKVDRSYVSQLETGVYSASVTMLGKLSKALGVEPSEFLKP